MLRLIIHFKSEDSSQFPFRGAEGIYIFYAK